MNYKHHLVEYAARGIQRALMLLGERRATIASALLAERLTPVVAQQTKNGAVRFLCPGEHPAWRARTSFAKEPETIEWIDDFEGGDVLWDVGANVGAFSLYAARRDVAVVSFEPSPGNYYVLNRNIELNGVGEKVLAYCLALNDETRLDSFYMTSTDLGSALHSFGEPIGWDGSRFTAAHTQSMIGFSIDDFIRLFEPPFPNHIKIDVDGNEDKILEGGRHTLADPRVKSVLVELDSEREAYCTKVIDLLTAAGLGKWERRQGEMVAEGSFAQVYNYIFSRDNVQDHA